MSDYQTKKEVNSTLDLDLIVEIPATLEDLRVSSNDDNVYNAAVRHSFYQGWNSRFRKTFVEVLEKQTGVKRRQQNKGGQPLVRVKKDGTEVPILETEKSYIRYLLDEKHITPADYATLGQEVADTIPFEVSKAEEEKLPAKEYREVAKKVLAAVEAGAISPTDGNIVTEESWTARWSAANPGYDIEVLGGFGELGIARAIEIDAKRRLQESIL